jgi:hypothetical protein
MDMLCFFNTLRERYPVHRDNFYARQATETARRWIAFANGKEPWERYHAGEAKIAICDDLVCWEMRTREENERISQADPRDLEGIGNRSDQGGICGLKEGRYWEGGAGERCEESVS